MKRNSEGDRAGTVPRAFHAAVSLSRFAWYTEIVMKNQAIEQIRKRFRREWLLIAVDKVDEATTTPQRGRLLAHSPRREEIDRASIKYPKPALVVFSEDALPPGYTLVFFLHG